MRRFFATGALLFIALLASLTVAAQSDKKSLVPSEEQRLKYAAVLKSSGTRLIRLLPREKYDVQNSRESPVARNATSVDQVPYYDSYPRALKTNSPARGGGAYYSFTRRHHEYGNSSHLSLEQGDFGVGFSGANYGFLTNLGDFPLEFVNLQTPAASLLATYKRATYDRDARRENRRFSEGIVVDGITFNQRMPMVPHSTYLLRAINYDDSDVLVAFRVVEVESDGTALILWKLLKRYSTPQLER